MSRLGFYFDSNMCIGCRACQVACKDRNRLGVGAIFRKVKSFQTGVYPNPQGFNYSGACNHCAEPKCVAGCPTGAMHVAEDGTVQHDASLCIGCQYCVWNCPYGAPQYIKSAGKVGKCDSCKNLREAGENPVCVDSCVMRCLKFGDLDKLAAEYGPGLVDQIPILPRADLTKPSLLVKPKGCALDPKFKELGV